MVFGAGLPNRIPTVSFQSGTDPSRLVVFDLVVSNTHICLGLCVACWLLVSCCNFGDEIVNPFLVWWFDLVGIVDCIVFEYFGIIVVGCWVYERNFSICTTR